MKSAKRYVVIAASFALCMMVFAAFAPRVAHAITATLVQVVNTSANPVPVQPNNWRQPVGLKCIASVNIPSGPFGLGFCTLGDTAGNAYTVPAGKRLIVELANGSCLVPPGLRPMQTSLSLNGGAFGVYLDARFQGGVPDIDQYSLASSGVFYADSGTQINFEAVTNGHPDTLNQCEADIAGHLEDTQ